MATEAHKIVTEVDTREERWLFNSKSGAVPLNAVNITSPFWKARRVVTRDVALPTMWERMKATGRWDVLKLEWKEDMPNRP